MEEEINSYLTFKVNGGIYGIHVSRIVEILAYERPQAKAGDAPFVIGLVQHRGTVIPLIDSGVKFDLGPITLTDQTYVVAIAVQNGDELFNVALAVDEVREVIEIPEETRKNIETSYKPGYVHFAAPIEGGLALILDPDKIFTDSDIVSLNQIAKQAN